MGYCQCLDPPYQGSLLTIEKSLPVLGPIPDLIALLYRGSTILQRADVELQGLGSKKTVH